LGISMLKELPPVLQDLSKIRQSLIGESNQGPAALP